MKLIKTVDGGFINIAQIGSLRPNTLSEPKPGQQRDVLDYQCLSSSGELLGVVPTAVLAALVAEAETIAPQPSSGWRQK